MASSIPIDDIDDRIIAIEERAVLADSLLEALKDRVVALEQVIVPAPPGTSVILPIIGITIVYTVPTP